VWSILLVALIAPLQAKAPRPSPTAEVLRLIDAGDLATALATLDALAAKHPASAERRAIAEAARLAPYFRPPSGGR
jgi:hypothetical protein